MLRTVRTTVQGYRTQDGAGVSLVRVLGDSTARDFDPFLMLDAFDSTDPRDYAAGFPMHPHRGIETVTYLARGGMVHEDHLGTRAVIHDGEAQWLTAGSGAFHSEMPQPAPRMLGTQLWLNLPARNKMTAAPFYHGITNDEIQQIPLEGGTLRLVAGSFGDATGFQGSYLPLDYYDVRLDPGACVMLPMPGTDRTVMAFTLQGPACLSGADVPAKTAALFGAGDEVRVETGEEPVELLLMSAPRLGEPIAWAGPIVMNTNEELDRAFADLDAGTFVREAAGYENREG